MKLKLIVLMLLGMTASYSQTAKKKLASKPAVKAAAAPKKESAGDGIFATFETSKGNIVVELAYKSTPITVANFVSLAEGTNTIVGEKFKGKHYYDGLKFHRVIADFMIQGGDPEGNGSGGPGYAFKDEITDAKFDKAGILAMANAGPATNGSQFFITHKETSWLNGKHTIFGYVTSGQDIVNAIAQGDLIKTITITRKGADAKAFDAAKIFDTYFKVTKPEEEKKMEQIRAAARKQQEELAAKDKKEYMEKFGAVAKEKAAYLNTIRKTATKTASGLEYKVISKGNGPKPADGSTIYFHYAGYFEDGLLFDSSYEDVNKAYGKYDENRAKQSGYNPYPFKAGQKTGMIPGFLEALSLMNIGDKMVVFIPSNLGYGEAGRAPVIPGNTNLIFELEIFDKMPEKK